MRKIALLMVIVLAASALTGCQTGGSANTELPTEPKQTEPSVPTEPSETKESTVRMPYIDEVWAMQAVLVDQEGNVLEHTELNVTVRVFDNDENEFQRDEYSIRFSYPDDVLMSASGFLTYDKNDTDNNMYPYTIVHGLAQQKGLDAGLPDVFYVSFDLERACLIVDMNDNRDVYLIAYRNADAEIADLWEHFQSFIQRVPKTWPQVTG